MNGNRVDFIITLKPTMGADVMHVFAELQELKEKGIANEFAQIDFNGTNLVAGIYENVYQFLETHVAVKNGDKEKILSNLPSNSKANIIGYALDVINGELAKRNLEKFSDEELDKIEREYQVNNESGKKL